MYIATSIHEIVFDHDLANFFFLAIAEFDFCHQSLILLAVAEIEFSDH